jgi:hypothetical protein
MNLRLENCIEGGGKPWVCGRHEEYQWHDQYRRIKGIFIFIRLGEMFLLITTRQLIDLRRGVADSLPSLLLNLFI